MDRSSNPAASPDREKPRVCNAYNTSPDLNNAWGDHGFTALSVRNDVCADLPSSCGVYQPQPATIPPIPPSNSKHLTATPDRNGIPTAW